MKQVVLQWTVYLLTISTSEIDRRAKSTEPNEAGDIEITKLLVHNWYVKSERRPQTLMLFCGNGSMVSNFTGQSTVITRPLHWNPRVILMPTLPSLVAPEVVVTTTSGVDNDNNVGVMATLVFSDWPYCFKMDCAVACRHFVWNQRKLVIRVFRSQEIMVTNNHHVINGLSQISKQVYSTWTSSHTYMCVVNRFEIDDMMVYYILQTMCKPYTALLASFCCRIRRLTHLPLVPHICVSAFGSALFQVMACRLFDVKPLPEPLLAYYQLDLWEQMSVKFESKVYHFHSRKCIWSCRLPKWWPFCTGGGGGGGGEGAVKPLSVQSNQSRGTRCILCDTFSCRHVIKWKARLDFDTAIMACLQGCSGLIISCHTSEVKIRPGSGLWPDCTMHLIQF